MTERENVVPRILIAECMQEISSFNPLPSQHENFRIEEGEAMLAQRGLNTAVGGALAVFAARGVEVVPAISARAGSAGLLSAPGWAQLSAQFIAAVERCAEGADGVYLSLHGAMGAEGDLDPEGTLLEAVRGIVGPRVPIVISLDLHGIATRRMLRVIDGFALYWTYPHVDFADTGERAARLLFRLISGAPSPAIVRVVIPALVRGDELITKTGCYGDLLLDCRRLEAEGKALAAGIMIGNPFTDVPELCSQVLLASEAPDEACTLALSLAERFWALRHRMQGKLVSVDDAIAQAKALGGPVVFTDAADATSSGATGDSNVIVRALVEHGFPGRVLAQIVDPPAAALAHRAGVGATIRTTLGGVHDPARFSPWPVEARVKLLSDGRTRLETMGTPLDAGPSAVLEVGNATIVVLSRTVSLFDRALYLATGCDPTRFDAIVVKSPHTEHHMYEAWVRKTFNVDAPGATSARLESLGHRICARPIFPLEPDTAFEPRAEVFLRDGDAR